MEISITKKDVVWGYIAQFFNISTGILVLPLILNKLSTEEVALNYLMLTVATMVSLLDFGFAPQFARNITYVFSGAKDLYKENVKIEADSGIDYTLLKSVIAVAKSVYQYLSIIVLVLMLTFGSWYIGVVTDGFSNVDNSLLIWLLYSLSTYFNIYYKYFDSLLTGRGMITESKKTIIVSRFCYLFLSYVLLFCGCGLMGVVIANLISPFVSRYMAYRYFYDKSICDSLSDVVVHSSEKKRLFSIIWYNAKKLGINFIGAYAILRFSMFIAGFYLTMTEVASYGLMVQLVGIILGISQTFFSTILPQISSYRVKGNVVMIIKRYALSLNVYLLLFILGSLFLLFVVPWLLEAIGSQVCLPSMLIVICYLIVNLLEGNHSIASSCIAAGNTIPFVASAIVTGIFICLGDILVLQFASWGILGLVLVQGSCQLVYNNWRWPLWICKDLQVSYPNLIKIGGEEMFQIVYNYGKRIFRSAQCRH